MRPPSFDLFRKDARGNPVWLDSAEDLETAQFRLRQLASALPGEYFAFDQTTHRIVLNLVGLASDQVH
jgi:hypothetical protein